MAATPAVPLTLPYIKHVAHVSLEKVAAKTTHPKASVKTIRLLDCKRQNAQHGQCNFTIKVTLKGTSVCVGIIKVRNIGHGVETAFFSVVCAPVRSKA